VHEILRTMCGILRVGLRGPCRTRGGSHPGGVSWNPMRFRARRGGPYATHAARQFGFGVQTDSTSKRTFEAELRTGLVDPSVSRAIYGLRLPPIKWVSLRSFRGVLAYSSREVFDYVSRVAQLYRAMRRETARRLAAQSSATGYGGGR